MNPERFRRLMDLVGEALEQPQDGRSKWLEDRCRGETELLAEARSLLAEASSDRLAALTGGIEDRVGRAAAWLGTGLDEPPERIGPYTVREVLGVGGMGIVYGAHEEEPLRRDVAVKVLRAGVQTPRIVERFERERRTLASLDHPYIAHVFDAGTTAGGLPYFAMEWVHGPPITTYCDDRRKGLRERVSLYRKVLEAVHYAHEKGIIHRDLKPSNVLVMEVGGDPIPKVIDFGIARVQPEGADGRTAHTAFGAVLGTVEYMSPEQALSPGAGVGTRSDIYSLGVLLYELLTGLLPYSADSLRRASPVELERLLRDTHPPPPSRRVTPVTEDADGRARARATDPVRLDRSLRGDLDNIVAKAMHKDPERRYASVAHFSDDLDRYLQGWPVSARPSTWGYRARRFVTRNRWSVAAGTAAALLMFGMASVFTYRLALERDRARVEAEKAGQVASFLQELFRVPDPSESAESGVTARQLLDDGAARIATELADQPEVQSSLLGVVGNTYRGLGLGMESERRLEEALALARAIYGDRHAEVATRLQDLGITQLDIAKLGAAEATLREALAMRTELLGESHPATATTMTHLALALRNSGQLVDAEAFGRKALDVHRATIEGDHPDLALSLHNLAFILRSRGALEESETLNREALAMRRRLHDASHPDVLLTLSNLANVLELRGNYAEAEELFRETLERRRERLGADHPATLVSLNNVAYLLWRTGQYPRADSLFTEGLAAARRIYGEQHTTLAIMLNNLGVARRRAFDLEAAERLHREALAMNRRLGGDDQPRVAGDMDNLGRVLLARGDAQAAERMHRDALALRTRLLGQDHPDLAESLSGLAEARLAQGEGAEAEVLMREALDLRTRALGEENPRTAATAHDFGAVLRRVGKLDEAERMLRDALDVRTAGLDTGHPDVAATLRELGATLTALGRYDEADAALRESRRLTVARLGEADPDTRAVDKALEELAQATRTTSASGRSP